MANNYITAGTATAAGTVTLYTAGSGTAFVGSLTVGETGGTPQTFSISVARGGAADNIEFYTHRDVPIPANDSYEKSGIVLDGTAGDLIRVIGSTTDVTFTLMGVEIS